jgi:hypothetical protein
MFKINKENAVVGKKKMITGEEKIGEHILKLQSSSHHHHHRRRRRRFFQGLGLLACSGSDFIFLKLMNLLDSW